MKIKKLEMGLVEIQAETKAESQAVNGIIQMAFAILPAAVANYHGCRKVGRVYRNWCAIPEGAIRPGMEQRLNQWRRLPDSYEFKRKGKP